MKYNSAFSLYTWYQRNFNGYIYINVTYFFRSPATRLDYSATILSEVWVVRNQGRWSITGSRYELYIRDCNEIISVHSSEFSMTPDETLKQGFRYMGLQTQMNGDTVCKCGNGFGKFGTSDGCNQPCSGNKEQTCGGRAANTILFAFECESLYRSHLCINKLWKYQSLLILTLLIISAWMYMCICICLLYHGTYAFKSEFGLFTRMRTCHLSPHEQLFLPVCQVRDVKRILV